MKILFFICLVSTQWSAHIGVKWSGYTWKNHSMAPIERQGESASTEKLIQPCTYHKQIVFGPDLKMVTWADLQAREVNDIKTEL